MVPKPPRRLKVSERYALARQRCLEGKYNAVQALEDDQPIRAFDESWIVDRRCECSKPERCPHGRWVEIERTVREREFHYTTTGHVDHIKHRSTHPELREDMGNLRLVAPSCHRRRHEDELKGSKA